MEAILEDFTGWNTTRISRNKKRQIRLLQEQLDILMDTPNYDMREVAQKKELIRKLSKLPFNWTRYLLSGKFGTQYCGNQYNPSLGRGVSQNWGYPRQDPFPPIILYPVRSSLSTVIVHLETVFPILTQMKISSGLAPFSNVCISPLIYVSYSDTETRIQAFSDKEDGWLQTKYSKEQYLKCNEYRKALECDQHNEYCEWDRSRQICNSRIVPETSKYQIPNTYHEFI